MCLLTLYTLIYYHTTTSLREGFKQVLRLISEILKNGPGLTISGKYKPSSIFPVLQNYACGMPKLNHEPPKLADLVIIVNENHPRKTWPLGKIKETYPGRHGQIRVVDVETCQGVYQRPVTKISVLLKNQFLNGFVLYLMLFFLNCVGNNKYLLFICL